MHALLVDRDLRPGEAGLGEGAEQNAPLGRAVIGGLAFATVLAVVTGPGWLGAPTLAPALAVGMATVALPLKLHILVALAAAVVLLACEAESPEAPGSSGAAGRAQGRK